MALVTQMDFATAVGGGTTLIPTAHPASSAEIAELARKLGVDFPADYRTFLGGLGSLLLKVHKDIWSPPQVGDVGPHWKQTRYELRVFGVCSEVDWLRVDVEAEQFRADNETDLVPVFAWANTSDRICFDPQGKLVEWTRHDDPTPLGESFDAVLQRLIAEQRAYKDEL